MYQCLDTGYRYTLYEHEDPISIWSKRDTIWQHSESKHSGVFCESAIDPDWVKILQKLVLTRVWYDYNNIGSNEMTWDACYR